jgi:hypothetical protein
MKSVFLTICFCCAVLRAQNVTVEVGSKPIGTRRTLNLEPGNGMVETCRDEGAASNRISCTGSVNSAVVSTHNTAHSNENYCFSSNGSTLYTCRLPYKALETYQAGMAFVLSADTTCTAACSLNVDNLGSVTIKRSDGTTDPAGALIASQPQWVFYDGGVFRLMGGGGNAAPRGAPGEGERDVRARRFIAAMETVPYARALTLETTAGDVHKTTTNNSIGDATIGAATAGIAGQHMWVIVVNDQISAKTITFANHLKSAGALTGTPGKTATLQFISDGSAWYEVARTTNL